MKKRVIAISVLPGQPTDGSGSVCVHLFVKDSSGLFTEPHVLHPEVKNGQATGGVISKPTRGRLACDKKKGVRPVVKKGVTYITHRTDDPRAVTCPGCIASELYKHMMAGSTSESNSPT